MTRVAALRVAAETTLCVAASAAELAQRAGSHQDDDACKAGDEAHRRACCHALAVDEEVGEKQGGERHDRHQDACQTAVDAVLSPGDEKERQGVSHDPQRDELYPDHTERRETQAGSEEENRQGHGADEYAREHDRGRRGCVHGNLGE
jgi:hypothetical protein